MPASVERRPALAKPPLAKLERWFQREVARPVERGRATAPPASVVLPSRHLSPKRRVAIYADMYFTRLLDCLREDYPAVAALAGPKGFERLARAYLARHPSRHYSLSFLGQRLPRFLRDRVPVRKRALLADVAELERAISEVFDAPPAPSLAPADLALVPPESWERGRVRLAPSLRLLAFDHRANAIVTACRQGKPLPGLGRERTFVAVYRKEWQVWRMDLAEPMHAVLVALQRGAPLVRALDAAARKSHGQSEDLQPLVYRSFREWASEGFIASVDRSASAR